MKTTQMEKTKLLVLVRDSKAVRGWEGLMMEKGSHWVVIGLCTLESVTRSDGPM